MAPLAALWIGAASSCGAGEIGAEALDHLAAARIVILGEIHDDPAHHANQARAVSALHPRALVFEMLTPAQVAGGGGHRPPRRRAPRGGAGLGWDRLARFRALCA